MTLKHKKLSYIVTNNIKNILKGLNSTLYLFYFFTKHNYSFKRRHFDIQLIQTQNTKTPLEYQNNKLKL